MPEIEVDASTKEKVVFAARMANVTEGEIVRRLVAALSTSDTVPGGGGEISTPIYADYEGHRTHARFHPPARVEITDGPLKGQSFGTPTGAARAVVAHYKPGVNDSRNGWTFWTVDNGGGPRVLLRSIRFPGS